jgi:16S rRNA (uracil1498-N3)-methyltransferase
VAHFYLTPAGTRLIAGETVVLTGDEARHATKAARLRVGERVLLGDGGGTQALAEAIAVAPAEVSLVVVSVEHHPELLPPLWLIQSLAKSGRDEQAIEQATEVGASEIIPLQAGRSVVSWEGEKKESGRARWQRIVTEATKQAIQPHLPSVREQHTIEDVCRLSGSIRLLALDHRADESLFDLDLNPSDPSPIAVVVGPEGGLSEQELEALVAAGATRVRMGPGVMRTSSAGPVALALLHQKLGHW